jgi:hypothetical protein
MYIILKTELLFVCNGTCRHYHEELKIVCMKTAAVYLGKGKVFSAHATKAYRGTRGRAPPILNLCTRWR